MASILFFIETILRKQFRCKYLEKQTAFSQYFSAFFKCSLNFEDFQKKKKKKNDSQSWGISEITDSEKHGYINA